MPIESVVEPVVGPKATKLIEPRGASSHLAGKKKFFIDRTIVD